MKESTWTSASLDELGSAIGQGILDPVELVESYLERIEQAEEKDKIFLQVFPEKSRLQAQAARRRAQSQSRLSLYDGIPLAWKDNIDIKGKPTSAGVPALASRIANRDAAVYEVAVRAGFVCLGKTNMTELAFSGLGINPSYGTPRNPFDHMVARVPGGSSSGSAVAVARSLCPAAIGTDSGGSVRIPAAWNGLVGLKTTAGAISTEGIVPLSQTLDTIGFLTHTVKNAGSLYHVFTQTQPPYAARPKPHNLHLLVASDLVWDNSHPEVASILEQSLQRMSKAGARVGRESIPEFQAAVELVTRHGNIVHYEGFKNWGKYLNAHPDIISPDILSIFNAGAAIAESEIDLVRSGLQDLQERYVKRVEAYSAVLMPTVVHIPPVIAELEADSALYAKENALALRNTRLANLLGLCALSLPVGFAAGGWPVGIMLVGLPHSEEILLQTAAALETLLRS
ncbi:MAG TPA: amidase family protein [Thermodesulfobacteriota bacterium]|nr:amidase [Deltaproteobacteria bacterium]HNU72170.1 amidase family protein [Thermodesulfobacteriota bacterium]